MTQNNSPVVQKSNTKAPKKESGKKASKGKVDTKALQEKAAASANANDKKAVISNAPKGDSVKGADNKVSTEVKAQDKDKKPAAVSPVVATVETKTEEKAAQKTKSEETHVAVNADKKDNTMRVDVDSTKTTSVNYKPSAAPSALAEIDEAFEKEENTQELDFWPSQKMSVEPLRQSGSFKAVQYAGLAGSFVWLAVCGLYVATSNDGLSNLRPHELGGFIAGVMAPIALFWMVLAYIQRGSDARTYAEALRVELQAMIFPSEERATQVNKDIERLTSQAAELAASSKAVLKSIHRARQGLRTEMREFAGLSKKAEFHIVRLSDSLEVKSTNLKDITSEIEMRVSTIDEKAQAGAEAWDNATLSILDRAGEIEGAMGKGADKINEASDKAQAKARAITKNVEDTSTALGVSIERIADRLSSISGEFEEHTSTLNNATDEVSKETNRLGRMISEQISELQDMTSDASESMAQASSAIKDQQDALENGATVLSECAENVVDMISSSTLSLEEAAEDIITKTDTIEGRLEAQSVKLGDTTTHLGKEADKIEETTKAAAHILSESVESAVTGAAQIGDSIRHGVESLNKATSEAQERSEDLIEVTTDHLEKINTASQGNVENLREMVELLEESHTQIQDAARMANEQVSDLSTSVDSQAEKITISATTLAERISSVSKSLEDPLRAIGIAIADADGRHEQIQTTLQRRVSDLNEASEKATDSAENIRTILRGQAQEISALSGQIAGNARTINEQMAQQREELAQGILNSLEQINHVQGELETTTRRLSEISDESGQDIQGLEAKIANSCELLKQESEIALAGLAKLDEDFELRSRDLSLRAEEAVRDVSNVSETLEESATRFEPLYDKVIDKSKEARAELEALRTGFDLSTSSNLDKLKQIGVLFDDRLTKLQDGSHKAANLLKTSSDHLRERVDDIEGAAKSASDKMRNISASMEGQSSDIHILTDQTLLKIENVQKAINDQFHELSEAVGQATAQLADAGHEFGRRSDEVDSAANRIVSRFDVAGQKARDESGRLNDAANKSVQLAEAVVAKVQTQSDMLVKGAAEALTELRNTGESFGIKAKEVSSQMKTSLDTSKSYGVELRAQVAELSRESSKTADIISKATSVLEGKVASVDKVANDVYARLEETGNKIQGQSDRLVSVTAKAVDQTELASESFSKQSASLTRASDEAVEKVEEIRQGEIRAQRETFMSSARFVMESLHSLSVDFVRMIEGEVPEKAWGAYQKGDIAVFTQHLAQLIDKLPIDKVREKFASDTEFRNYVQRYIRQFEDVYDQALETDRGELIATTFLVSDIGKMYKFLCQSSGRDARTMGDVEATTGAAPKKKGKKDAS